MQPGATDWLVSLVGHRAEVLLVSEDLGAKVAVAPGGAGHCLRGHVDLEKEEEGLTWVLGGDTKHRIRNGVGRCITP